MPGWPGTGQRPARLNERVTAVMSGYIGVHSGLRVSHVKPLTPFLSQLQTFFPILLLSRIEIANMSSSASRSTKTGRPRGRRAAARVPCDDCIARASEEKKDGTTIELCNSCTAVLHRPKRRQQEQPAAKRSRKQSSTVVDTDL